MNPDINCDHVGSSSFVTNALYWWGILIMGEVRHMWKQVSFMGNLNFAVNLKLFLKSLLKIHSLRRDLDIYYLKFNKFIRKW